MTLYERGDPKRNHTNLKNGRYRHVFSTPRNYSVVQGTRYTVVLCSMYKVPGYIIVLCTSYDVHMYLVCTHTYLNIV